MNKSHKINDKYLFLGPVAAALFFAIGILFLGLIYSLVAMFVGPGAMLDSVPAVSGASITGAKALIGIGAFASAVWLWKNLVKLKSS